jgi:UDP-glucose:(heptosyl)LPS alpha-1,3-glucosyltransferase
MKAKMRICLAIQKYFEFGGLQRNMMRVAQELVYRGHNVDILCGSWRGPVHDDISPAIVDTKALSNPGKNHKLARAIAQRRSGYDCIVGYNKMPGLDIYYAGDVCLKEILSRSNIRKWLPRYRHFLRQEESVFGTHVPTKIMIMVPALKSTYQKHYGTPDDRFFLLPPQINREKLLSSPLSEDEKQELRSTLRIDREDAVLLHVGSSFHRKGVDRIIRALACLSSDLRKITRLVVVGEDKTDKYKRLAKQMQVSENTIFVGPSNQVSSYYQIADYLVHPAREEVAGATLLESLLFGVPVLTIENCGFSFHIKNAKAGIVVNGTFQQEAFNSALGSLLISHEQDNWRSNALKYAKTTDLYSLPQKAADYVESYSVK